MTPTPPRLFAELFAGTASLSLWLLGCPQPPCGYMGSKRRFASEIAAVAGLRSALGAGAILLVDAGPWGRTWPTLVGERGDDVVRLLRQWADDCDPFELWYELCASPEPVDDVEHAAAYLWLQARSASTTPVWWTAGALADLPEHLRLRGAPPDPAPAPPDALTAPPDAAESSPQSALRQASSTSRTAKGISGHTPWQTGQVRQGSAPTRGSARDKEAWQQGHRDPEEHAGLLVMSGAGSRNPRTGELYAKDSVRPATIKGSTRPRTPEDGPTPVLMAEKRARGRREKGAVPRSAREGEGARMKPAERADGKRKSNGVQTPHTIATRIEVIRGLRWPRVVVMRAHPQPREVMDLFGLETLTGSVVYLDPPYVGCTPYAVDCPRAEVVRLARAYSAAGAHVVISEAVSLADDLGIGWEAVEITGSGRAKREVLTVNRPPSARPAHQLALFGAR